jgi:hypothetical protein
VNPETVSLRKSVCIQAWSFAFGKTPEANPQRGFATAPGAFRLEFAPVGAVKLETLEYDLMKGREE